MASDLIALANIINSSVHSIDGVCSQTGKPFPSLDKPWDASESSSEGIRNHPKISNHISYIVAAAYQLIQTVQYPAVTVANNAFGGALTAALSLVEAKDIPELVRLSGGEGMHVKEIAKQTDLDPVKLGAVLRQLATHHYFTEISPDVFANNLLSSLVDSGKDPRVEDFKKTKHQDTKTMSALVSYGADDSFKACSYLADSMIHPEFGHSFEFNSAAFQLAFNTKMNAFDYVASTPDAWKAVRFGHAMANLNNVHPPEGVFEAFDWKSLPKNSLVVDVGSGLGHVSLPVAKAFPSLKFALEDRPEVIPEAKKYWQTNLPSRTENENLYFFAANFFEPQPAFPQVPSLFFMRYVLHDWNNEQAIAVLRNLRKVAGPHTKLVILEAVADYACPATPATPSSIDNNRISSEMNGVEGRKSPTKSSFSQPFRRFSQAKRHIRRVSKDFFDFGNSRSSSSVERQSPVPPPLLENLGYANAYTHTLDLNVRAMINAGERVIGPWYELINQGGWKVETIRKLGGSRSWSSSIICAPGFPN